jgi:hypothetical protein
VGWSVLPRGVCGLGGVVMDSIYSMCARCINEISNGESSRTQTSGFEDWHNHDVEAVVRDAGILLVVGDGEYGFCDSDCERCHGLPDDRYEVIGFSR